MSDFGTSDHYVAAVKGKMLSEKPDQQIIDITHSIKPFDISIGATILKSVFKEFPKGTVHLVSVDGSKERTYGLVVIVEDHIFIGYDSGLFSMISEHKPTVIQRIELGDSTFPTKDVLASMALKLANGTNAVDLGTTQGQMTELFSRQLKLTKKEIVGNVINIDSYGNLISNITRDAFEKILELNGQTNNYIVRCGRESFNHIHSYYTDVDSGDCFILFNSIGHLQIGINKGNASQLLGLGIDAPIHIEF